MSATYSLHQVAEDLADFFLCGDESITNEIEACTELSSLPTIRGEIARVRAARMAIEDAHDALSRAATIEARDYVAAWMAFKLAERVLQAISELLVFAGVLTEERRREHDWPTWKTDWRAFVASGRAWEFRTAEAVDNADH